MLSIRNVHKSFEKGTGARRILHDVSIDVQPGEIFTLLGPSGCGKTTLLRMIAGLDTPDGGAISFDGQAWADPAKRRFVPPQQRHIGLVFQSYAIWPHLSVFDNIAYPLRQRGRNAENRSRRPSAVETIERRVEKILDAIGLTEQRDRMAQELSGGQQQRVALGRAVIDEPRLLLLDEPFSNLDVSLRQKLRLELKALQARLGVTMVLVTHDQEDAFALSDRIAVLNAGRVEQIATAEVLHDQPASGFVHDFIGKSSALRATVSHTHSDGRVGVRIGARPLAWSAESSTRQGVAFDHVGKTALAGTDMRSLRAGQALVLRVRPGDVQLRPDGVTKGTENEAGNHASNAKGPRVQVQHNILAGDRYETYVTFADGQQLMVYQPRHAALQAGQYAVLHFTATPFFDTSNDAPPLPCLTTPSSMTSSWPTTSLPATG